jgi:hypothetical protein
MKDGDPMRTAGDHAHLPPAIASAIAEANSNPYRWVDAHDIGWHPMGGDDRLFADFAARHGLEPMLLDDLRQQRGPLRPVIGVPDADAELLAAAWRDAGRLAAGSVLVALYRLFKGPEIEGNEADDIQARSEQMQDRARKLVAGRAGSWESALLSDLAWSPGGDIEERPSRWHPGAVDTTVEVIWRWVSNPDYLVEVAESLGALFDEHTRQSGGWDRVADRYLVPGDRWSMNWAERAVDLLNGSQRWGDS